MPAKKPPNPNEKPQHERFKEAANKIEADTTGKDFERAFARVVPPKSKRTPRD